MHIQFRTILSLALASLMIANSALAQSIDLSPVQNLLQGIVDTITGPLGIVIGTLALIGVFLSWLFGILDFRQALWVLVAIAGSAAPRHRRPENRRAHDLPGHERLHHTFDRCDHPSRSP